MAIQDVTGVIVKLGCYVQRVTAGLGLNTQATNVDIELVPGSPNSAEDIANNATGFVFSEATPGNTLGITVGAFDFRGIITSWSENDTIGGVKYNVRLADPRPILDNIPVVCNFGIYPNDAPDIPNVLNAAKYYGHPKGLGIAQQGVIFKNIRDYLSTSGIVDLYGTRFKFSFGSGFLDATGTSNTIGVPPWYQTPADLVSFNQLCQQVGTDHGFDYFVTIDNENFDPMGVNDIVIHTIDRVNATGSTEIVDFIQAKTASGLRIGHRRGQELRTDPISCVVSGPPLRLWGGGNSAGGQSLISSWGRTKDGSILYNQTQHNNRRGMVLLENIVGSGVDSILSNSAFEIDYTKPTISRNFTVDTYPPTMSWSVNSASTTGYYPHEKVLQAALFNQDAWEALFYKYHQTNAELLGINYQVVREPSDYQTYTTGDFSPLFLSLSPFITSPSGKGNRGDAVEALISAVYEATREAAESYYGKTYLISPDQYSATFNSDWLTNNTFASTAQYPQIEYTPISHGWNEGNGTPSGVTNHEFLKNTTNAIYKDQIGCTTSFVSYNNYKNGNSTFEYAIDTSIIPNTVLFIDQGDKLCIPVQAQTYDEYPVWTEVTIPYTIQGVINGSGYDNQMPYYMLLKEFGYSDSQINKWNLMKFAGENTQYGLAPPRPFVMQSAPGNYGIHVAYEFNTKTYGPWIVTGIRNGGVSLIRDDSLAPWTFGSYDDMNSAGNQTAVKHSAPSDIVDSAEITIAGLPEFNLGHKIGNNSTITNISFQYGPDGLTTTYSMQTFSLPQQRLTKLLFDKISNIYNQNKILERQIVDIDKAIGPPANNDLIFKPEQVYNSKDRGKGKNKGSSNSFDKLVGSIDYNHSSGIFIDLSNS